jgi:hypothetical protein
MATGLLIGFAVAGALICPLMMLLGRRGIRPNCILGRCADDDGSAESLRRRQQELATRIIKLESGEVPADSLRLACNHDRQGVGHRKRLRRHGCLTRAKPTGLVPRNSLRYQVSEVRQDARSRAVCRSRCPASPRL